MWKPQICTKFGDERGIQVCIYILATENGTKQELNGFKTPFDHRYVLLNGTRERKFQKGENDSTYDTNRSCFQGPKGLQEGVPSWNNKESKSPIQWTRRVKTSAKPTSQVGGDSGLLWKSPSTQRSCFKTIQDNLVPPSLPTFPQKFRSKLSLARCHGLQKQASIQNVPPAQNCHNCQVIGDAATTKTINTIQLLSGGLFTMHYIICSSRVQ